MLTLRPCKNFSTSRAPGKLRCPNHLRLIGVFAIKRLMFRSRTLSEEFRYQNVRKGALYLRRRIAKKIGYADVDSLASEPDRMIQSGERIEADLNLGGFKFASHLTKCVGKICLEFELARS